MAPIYGLGGTAPLGICVLVQTASNAGSNPLILLRELPGARVYLGAVCDTAARIQEWLEIWVQTLELRDLTFSGYQERLSNHAFDERWRAESGRLLETLPNGVIVTGLEEKNPGPILIKRQVNPAGPSLAPVEATSWRICKDDAMLESFGLPPFATSPFRFLHDPAASGPKTFLATSKDAPVNSHVQSVDRLMDSPDVLTLFNPHAGLIRTTRFNPLEIEDHLQILEGRAWEGSGLVMPQIFPGSIYMRLQAWSASPKGLPFLLHGGGSSDRLNEIFFLKLSSLCDMFKEVRASVRASQLPMLNLTPSSFRVSLPETGDQFPGLWAAKCHLAKPGQAFPLKIKSTEQKYFIRLGPIEPSPFLPEGLGAHSFGIGNVRIRTVTAETDGLVLEGTLVAEDYLGLDPHDLLWIKLPVAEERLEFYAHVYKDPAGPREARFRTVPAKLSEKAISSLKLVAGTIFPRSPYEIWPLLSSPCDLFSLGVIAVRTLLTNSRSDIAIILDEVLSFSRTIGKEPLERDAFQAKLKSMTAADQRLLDLISPHALTESAGSPKEARAKIQMELWLQAIELLLRLFPGTGSHSFCKSFGDVSPLALESVFDRPIQELETLIVRLRSVLTPTFSENKEIADVLRACLKTQDY